MSDQEVKPKDDSAKPGESSPEENPKGNSGASGESGEDNPEGNSAASGESSDDDSLLQKLGKALRNVVDAVQSGDDDNNKPTGSQNAQSGQEKKREQLPVLKPHDDVVMRMLGLGRGVDGTNPTPWLNRTNFQVRKVTDKTIHGTEEGGTVQKYVREVTSVRSQQSAIKASIDVPKAPLTIGVDAEYSRTFTKTRKSVGIRVHNRTIGFWMDFDDVSDWKYCNPDEKPLEPKTEETPLGGGLEDAGNDSDKPNTEGGTQLGHDEPNTEGGTPPGHDKPNTEGGTPPGHDKPNTEGGTPPGHDKPNTEGGTQLGHDKPNTDGGTQPGHDEDESVKYTFEERICRWILSQLDHPVEEVNPFVEKFTQHFKKCKKCSHKSLVRQCLAFINFFHITHYVSAIQLGAVKYYAFEEEEYRHEIDTSAGAAVEKVGTLDLSTNFDWKDKVQQTAMSCIGVMDGYSNLQNIQDIVVNREGEAVIGAQIQPISQLIRDPDLKLSLQIAIKSYMDEVQDDKEGPFYITCNNDNIFLAVCDPDKEDMGDGKPNEVIGVREQAKASHFYIVPTYDTKHPHEFAIAYFSEPRFLGVSSIPRYLDTPINVWGELEGPLKMSFSATEHNCQLNLRSRLSPRYKAPGDITPWIAEQDAFYVQCSHRWFRWNGYLCVKLQKRDGRANRYITACVKSLTDHSEEKKIYMVFRLIRVKSDKALQENAGRARHDSAGSPEATTE